MVYCPVVIMLKKLEISIPVYVFPLQIVHRLHGVPNIFQASFIEYLEHLPVTRYQEQGPQRGHLPKVIAGISEG